MVTWSQLWQCDRTTRNMTTEEIKKIVDDERAEQLTALLCLGRWSSHLSLQAYYSPYLLFRRQPVYAQNVPHPAILATQYGGTKQEIKRWTDRLLYEAHQSAIRRNSRVDQDVVTYLLFTKTSVTRNVLSDRRLHVTVTLVFMQSTMLTSLAPCGHARCGDPCWRWWREYH